jgi:hypothetical protein
MEPVRKILRSAMIAAQCIWSFESKQSLRQGSLLHTYEQWHCWLTGKRGAGRAAETSKA